MLRIFGARLCVIPRNRHAVTTWPSARRWMTATTADDDSGIKWTREEDLALQLAVKKHGTNWSRVVQVLPEKSPGVCKTRWKHLVQTWRSESPSEKEKRLRGSKRLVKLAMAGNAIISISKLGAAMHTGSSSLYSESIHSLMDMINQGLLMVGIERSLRQPNPEHPYGFHKEQYAWAIISAVGILFVGGGVPIYNGITSYAAGASAVDFSHLPLAYGVLGAALCAEGFTASQAYLQVKRSAERAGTTIKEYIRHGSDPTSVQVLLEDSSSVFGSLIAGTSLTLSWYLNMPAMDALGSVCIGGLLSSVAVFLIRRNVKMVVETSMPPPRIAMVQSVLADDPLILSVQDVKTSSLGPEDARFKAEITLDGKVLTKRYIESQDVQLDQELLEIKKLQTPQELEAYLSRFGTNVVTQLGDEIDRIEEDIKDAVPEVKHVDLEIN